MLYFQYLDINLSVHVQLDTISLEQPALTLSDCIQLAWFQLRALPINGGLNLLSMLAATDPAFTAAHLCHLKQLADDSIAGPYHSISSLHMPTAAPVSSLTHFGQNMPTLQFTELCSPALTLNNPQISLSSCVCLTYKCLSPATHPLH
jgi:hypothetical protein